MGIAQWESHGNGNWLRNWEWNEKEWKLTMWERDGMEWECKKPFPITSTVKLLSITFDSAPSRTVRH